MVTHDSKSDLPLDINYNRLLVDPPLNEPTSIMDAPQSQTPLTSSRPTLTPPKSTNLLPLDQSSAFPTSYNVPSAMGHLAGAAQSEPWITLSQVNSFFSSLQ